MPLIAFDTLEYAQSLQRAGISRKDAEAFAKANSEAFRAMLSQQELATKSDLEKLRLKLESDIDKLRLELKGDNDKLRQELKGDMDKLRQELKGDMDKLRLELNASLEKVREETKADMARLETTLTKHIFNMLLAFAGAIGAFFTIAAFFLKT